MLVAVGLIFDFLNGFHDSANVVATIITSGAMKPSYALIMAALAEFTGPFLFGVAVAKTIGKDIVNPIRSRLASSLPLWARQLSGTFSLGISESPAVHRMDSSADWLAASLPVTDPPLSICTDC